MQATRWGRILWRAWIVACALMVSACDVTLYAGVAEKEANEMISELMRNAIPASKTLTKEGATVMVDESDFPRAVDLLKRAGYPSEGFVGMGDIFKKDGLISSPTEERARFLYALSQELSATISQIDGVLSARVHVVVPQTNSPLVAQQPSSAAVMIRHREGIATERLTSQIKLLITNAVEGLLYDKVSVTLFQADPITNGAAKGNELIKVFGVWVHPSSSTSLRLTMYLLLAIAGVGLLFGAWMYWSLQRAERQVRQYRRAAVVQRQAPARG